MNKIAETILSSILLLVNRLPYMNTTTADTKEKFIHILQETGCDKLIVEIKRVPVASTAEREKEIVAYKILFFAKHVDGRKIVFPKKWGKFIERTGDFIYDISFLLQVVEVEKDILSEIRKIIPAADVQFIIPEKKYFREQDYKDVLTAMNT